MIKKMAPIQLSEESAKEVQQQLGTQEVVRETPKSLDPVNFPVFDTPINKKVLIYVPNHTYVDTDGVEQLRMDKPLIHFVQDGRRYLYYRCIHNVVSEEHGLTGECPLCDACEEPWDLANFIVKERCESQGLDSEDKENKNVKSIRSAAFNDRVIKEAVRRYTFPIVVLSTKDDDGKTLLKDDSGKLQFKIMWYSVSEAMYQDKWVKALEAMEDEPNHPGGNFFILNFTYQSKNGREPSKFECARNYAVNHRNIKNSQTLATKFDALTEEWTPVKASTTVCNNLLYSTADLQYVADSVLIQTRNLITMYSSKAVLENNPQPSDGFELQEVPTGSETADVDLEMDETDMDLEEA